MDTADARTVLADRSLPPADRLAVVVGSLAAHLPTQMAALLASDRFADGRGSLARVASPDRTRDAVAQLDHGEAERLLCLTLERWEAIADVVIGPAAIVVGPGEVWVSEETRAVAYRVVTIGVDDGWRAEWSSGSSTLTVAVPSEGQAVDVRHIVRVFSRVGGRREVIVGERRVIVRRPYVALAADAGGLRVTDQCGRPAVSTAIVLDGEELRTDEDGCVKLEHIAPSPPSVIVDGQRAAERELR